MESEGAAPPTIEPSACTLESNAYRIDQLVVPFDAVGANQMAFDLDGDSRRNNALAQIFTLIYVSFETAQELWPASIQAPLDDGTMNWLIVVETCSDGTDPNYVQIGLRRAADADGDGIYEIAGDDLQPAVGEQYAGGMSADSGEGMVPAALLVDIMGGHAPGWVRGDAMMFSIRNEPDGTLTGSFGLGMPDAVLDAAAPPLTDFFTWRLEEGTSEIAAEMDVDMDGIITADEMYGHEWVGPLLTPDVDLMAEYRGEEVLWPLHDGEKDRRSLGLGFHAEPVSIEN